MSPTGTHSMATEFDVVILGAGFAAICQARHLLLNEPGIRVALVDLDPAGSNDDDMEGDESLTEIAAVFVNKELGLHDYMIEHHAPRQGLSFHWPKRYDQTESLDDYFRVGVNRESNISNFHVNRAKYERDVLAMTRNLGAVYIQGHVLDLDLTSGDRAIAVVVETEASRSLALNAKHVVDAAGRRFIIGKQRDNLLFGSESTRGIDNGCAWIRARNVDRTVFHDGLDPNNTTTTRYYCTNHWFGHGHWVWQIPSWGEARELSVGVVHHHDVIPADALGSREAFYEFLEKNHNLVYRLVTSGEEVEFGYRPRLAHRSKQMFSPDNWYVIGDAAHFFDPFYSQHTAALAVSVESVTEIIRAKLRGEPDAETKRKIFDDFNLALARSANVLVADHGNQLGHASAMSWRIFYEYMWSFGLHLPMFVGKWHLDPGFVKAYLDNADPLCAPGGLFDEVYQTLDEVVDEELNIGLMDAYRADQLGHYVATDHDKGFRFGIATEPRKCNVFHEWKRMAIYMAWWYTRLQWRVHGVRGVMGPRKVRRLLGLLRMAAVAGSRDLAHRVRMFGKRKNTVVARNLEESFAYRRQPALEPWGDDIVASSGTSEMSDAPARGGVSMRSSA